MESMQPLSSRGVEKDPDISADGTPSNNQLVEPPTTGTRNYFTAFIPLLLWLVFPGLYSGQKRGVTFNKFTAVPMLPDE